MQVVAAGECCQADQGDAAPHEVQDNTNVGVVAYLVQDDQQGAGNIVQLVPKRLVTPAATADAVKTKQQQYRPGDAESIIDKCFHLGCRLSPRHVVVQVVHAVATAQQLFDAIYTGIDFDAWVQNVVRVEDLFDLNKQGVGFWAIQFF